MICIGEDEMMLSIIIPIYNMERYLKRCLDSILCQTYSDFECLLVDDGSADGSATICKEYCEKDNRFRYIYKENGGVSDARNLGLVLAEGEIVGFVDPDDWVERCMYQKMIESMYQVAADIVMCGINIVSDKKKYLPYSEKNYCISRHDITPELLCMLAGSVWRCIYNKEILGDIWFTKGLRLSEDRVFNLYILGKSSRIFYMGETRLYNYFMRNDSVVHQYCDDMFESVKQGYREICRAVKREWGEEFMAVYDNQFVIDCYSTFNKICSFKSPYTISQKISKIKQICDSSELNFAIANVCHRDWRVKWIKEKKYIKILCYTILANIKNHRQ